MRPTKLPGTTIETGLSQGVADRHLTPMFLGGGLVLSQVCQLAGLEGYIIQNWVKRKYISPPEHKKYNQSQLCRIFNINLLKDTFSLEQISVLLTYINGDVLIKTDNMIDDSKLYSYLVDCLALLGAPERLDPSRISEIINRVTANYHSPYPGAAKHLFQVLEIMITAYEAGQIKNQAQEMYAHLDYK